MILAPQVQFEPGLGCLALHAACFGRLERLPPVPIAEPLPRSQAEDPSGPPESLRPPQPPKRGHGGPWMSRDGAADGQGPGQSCPWHWRQTSPDAARRPRAGPHRFPPDWSLGSIRNRGICSPRAARASNSRLDSPERTGRLQAEARRGPALSTRTTSARPARRHSRPDRRRCEERHQERRRSRRRPRAALLRDA
jgi:hypothetical protein